MRTLHSFATVCVLGAALAALVTTSACSSDDPAPTNTAGAAGTPGAAGAPATAGAPGAAGGGTTLTGDATRGAALWVKPTLGCDSCHGLHAEGGNAPNITKSVTGGIGAFTQAQFHNSVRKALTKEGVPLCTAMIALSPQDASDQDIADMYAYQQAQPAVDTPVASPAFCASMCCKGESVK
ncbi:MAG TPA: c-type cytochrome [Polyangiaceae bacterium]|nr:c-type cytochrome [Polyangiaceae bacterium]